MPYFMELSWRGPRGKVCGVLENRLPANSTRAHIAEAFAGLIAHVARVLDAYFGHVAAAPAAGAIGRSDARSTQRALARTVAVASFIVCRQARHAPGVAGILPIFFDEFATADGRREIA